MLFGDAPAAQDNTPNEKEAELIQTVVEVIAGTEDVIAIATRATAVDKSLQKQNKQQKKTPHDAQEKQAKKLSGDQNA